MRAIVVLGLLIALGTVGLAGAASWQKVRIGELIVEFDGDFKPKKLSRTKPTPLSFTLSAKIREADGSHPPALRKFNVLTDRNGTIQTKGLPTCRPGQLVARKSEEAMAVCGKTLVGRGTATAEIALADQPPVLAKSALLAFNGGTKGNTLTLYVHAYLTIPVPAAIVTTVKIRKVHRGRYGTESLGRIPPIASGAGSVRFFRLTIDRKYRHKGKRRSVLTARCRDGKFKGRAEAVFADGTKARAVIVRPCTPTR